MLFVQKTKKKKELSSRSPDILSKQPFKMFRTSLISLPSKWILPLNRSSSAFKFLLMVGEHTVWLSSFSRYSHKLCPWVSPKGQIIVFSKIWILSSFLRQIQLYIFLVLGLMIPKALEIPLARRLLMNQNNPSINLLTPFPIIKVWNQSGGVYCWVHSSYSPKPESTTQTYIKRAWASNQNHWKICLI
jgi:hypothetical protein